MITIYNSDLDSDTIESLKHLLNKDISPKIAFDLLKITTLIETIVDNKSTIYNKIVAKYAKQETEVKEGQKSQLIVEEEDVQNFQMEMEELLGIKHEIGLDKINFEDLKLKENIKSMTLSKLKFLFYFDLPEIKTTGGEIFNQDQDSLKIENSN